MSCVIKKCRNELGITYMKVPLCDEHWNVAASKVDTLAYLRKRVLLSFRPVVDVALRKRGKQQTLPRRKIRVFRRRLNPEDV